MAAEIIAVVRILFHLNPDLVFYRKQMMRDNLRTQQKIYYDW